MTALQILLEDGFALICISVMALVVWAGVRWTK